jgi:hypothetical protein
MAPFPAGCGRKEISQALSFDTGIVRYSSCLEEDHWCWTSGWRCLSSIVELTCSLLDGSCPNALSILRSYGTLDLKGFESHIILVMLVGICLANFFWIMESARNQNESIPNRLSQRHFLANRTECFHLEVISNTASLRSGQLKNKSARRRRTLQHGFVSERSSEGEKTRRPTDIIALASRYLDG